MRTFSRVNNFAINTLLSVCLLGCLLWVNASHAEANKQAQGNKQLLIDQTYLDPKFVLPPAPTPSSEKGRIELIDVKTLLAKVTPEQRRQAAKDATTKDVSFFADTVPNLDLSKLPLTKALFEQVRYTEDTEAKIFKNYFLRKRPYITDPSIQPCIDPEKDGDDASYPSGHAPRGFSMGVVLANLIPEQAPAILERANKYAENRMICGVHHLSDIVAGQVLGTIVAIELMKNEVFRQQMNAAKSELKAAGLTR
jgi:acid phosphatase (class A)